MLCLVVHGYYEHHLKAIRLALQCTYALGKYLLKHVTSTGLLLLGFLRIVALQAIL